MVALAVVLTACGSDDTAEPIAFDTLTSTGGCGQAFFFAADQNSDTVLTVAAEPVFEPLVSGTTTVELPDERVDVRTLIGRQQWQCTDVLSNETGTTDEHAAASGRATIGLDFPSRWEEQPWLRVGGTVTLDDVTFADGSHIEHMTWDAEVGWSPG